MSPAALRARLPALMLAGNGPSRLVLSDRLTRPLRERFVR